MREIRGRKSPYEINFIRSWTGSLSTLPGDMAAYVILNDPQAAYLPCDTCPLYGRTSVGSYFRVSPGLTVRLRCSPVIKKGILEQAKIEVDERCPDYKLRRTPYKPRNIIKRMKCR